jgi:protein-disulfide isomerase
MTAPDSSPAPGGAPGRLPVAVAVLALLAAAYVWVSLSNDIADLRERHRLLAEEVLSLRGSTTLDVAGAPARGSDTAIVTIVEFSDYECPYCIKYTQETLPQVDAEYVATGRVRYVFRDFPIDTLHPEAMRAHEAAQCAAEQDRFWDLHYRLFSAPGTHTDAELEARAMEAGLNLPEWRECLASGRTRAAIEASVATAEGLGASGTPTFLIGLRDQATGRIRIVRGITGAQPFEVFQQALDAILTQLGN